jgi:excisionase family DNA binding protein
MEQLLYTVSDCCRLTGLGRTKFYELVASGAIPLRKVGKKSLIAAADLKRWAEELPASKETVTLRRSEPSPRLPPQHRSSKNEPAGTSAPGGLSKHALNSRNKV